MKERIERLNMMINDGRIIRNDWVGTDEQGRETACLLAALSPEVAEQETASACPADVMPTWLAYLTPWMDDSVSESTWPSAIRRYAACAARWPTLDNAAWRRVEIAARRACVVEAMSHTTEERVLDAHRAVLAWLDDDMPEQPHEGLWAAAQVAAAWAVEAAAESARAEAAAEREAVDAAEAEAAQAAAADRITDAILTALEKECGLNQKEEA